MKQHKSPFDKDTHYRIVPSETPVDVDGYKLGEPKFIECEACEAREKLTPEPSPGVDELPHHPLCRQRFVKSDWWFERFMRGEIVADAGADAAEQAAGD